MTNGRRNTLVKTEAHRNPIRARKCWNLSTWLFAPGRSSAMSGPMERDHHWRDTVSGRAFTLISVGLIVAHVALKAVAGSWGVVGVSSRWAAQPSSLTESCGSGAPKDVEAPNRHVGWHHS